MRPVAAPSRVIARYRFEDAGGASLVPLLVLQDVALHERHADGLAAPDQRAVLHAPRAPGGQTARHEHAAATGAIQRSRPRPATARASAEDTNATRADRP